MLRRVQSGSHSVTGAATAFGFSRPSFYQALSPSRRRGWRPGSPQRGPKQAHKLTDELLAFLVATRQKEPPCGPGTGALAPGAFGTKVIPAASNAACCVVKKNSAEGTGGSTANHPDLTAQYEQLRRDATVANLEAKGWGWPCFSHGMTAWMQAWSQCTDRVALTTSPAATPTAVPMDLQRQIAALLAGIILSLQQEASHERNHA